MFEGIKVIVGVISLFLVYRTITSNCNKYLAFAICAIWLRFFLSAFHTITYPSLVAGFSINALGSIGVAGLGLILLPTAVFTLRKLLPFYFFFAAITVSGLINMEISGTLNVLVKWCYFLVVASATFLSIRVQGQNETFKKLLVAFAMPLTLQFLSVMLGHTKATESDGSTSYIGGYNHEAAFSMIIVSFIFLVGLVERGTLKLRTLLFSLSVVLLVLVNYRTSVLAILPITAVFFYTLIETRLKPSQKVPVMTIVVMVLIFSFMVLSFTMRERFSDVAILISNLDIVLKAPIYFSETEKDIMSARVYIWSQYIDAYRSGGLINQLFGYGAESWNRVFPKYAHNTFVSYLYEFGLIGIITFVMVLGATLFTAMKIASASLSKTVSFSILGFITMNLATMPLWNIEGLIFFSIVQAVVFSSAGKVRQPSKDILTSQHNMRAFK